MADYQEYRRRVLHRRWRRMFMSAALFLVLLLLVMLALLWRRFFPVRLHSAQAEQTLLARTLPSSDWSTLDYTRQEGLVVQTLADGSTAMDFRLASLPKNEGEPVDLSYFNDVTFLGDSLTQGFQIYDTGLPNAHYCAYRGVGPNAVVNGTTCTRVDGQTEIPMEALVASQPKAVYILLGTNVLTRDTDYSGFLSYYGRMLDMIRQALPDAVIYVQSITPVRPEVRTKENHDGMYGERFCRVNNDLAALALEKGCIFLNLWEFLADESGNLKVEYAQPDGYHLTSAGYAAWVEYLRTHAVPLPTASAPAPNLGGSALDETNLDQAASADSAASAAASSSAAA